MKRIELLSRWISGLLRGDSVMEEGRKRRRLSILLGIFVGVLLIAIGLLIHLTPLSLEEDANLLPTPAPSSSPPPAPEPPPPSPPPTTSGCTKTYSGNVSLPRLDIGEGEIVCFDPNATTTVELSGNVVVRGTLRMRPENASVTHTIRFINVNESRFVGGETQTPQDTDVGLWIIEHGSWEADGSAKTAWLRAKTGLTKGATTIDLASAPTGWQVGDELAITPTLPPTAAKHYDAYDYPTIKSMTGSKVTFNGPVAFDHPAVAVAAGKTQTAEVLNLTRNVRVEGQPGKRAHVIFLHGHQKQTVRYAAFRYLGPQRAPDAEGNIEIVLGRYGFHLHMLGEAARGSLAEGLVLRDLGNRGYVSHGSHGVTAREVIVHNAYANGFWWDDTRGGNHQNASHDNLWEKSVASRITYTPDSRGFRISGYNLMGGLNNILRDSVAVGIQGGRDASGVQWPEGESSEAGKNSFGKPSGVWGVERIVTHNNKNDGWFTWQNTANLHKVGEGSINYYNGDGGLDHGAYSNNYLYQGVTLYANGTVGIKILAASKDDPAHPLTFDHFTIDQAGLTDYAVMDADHHFPATQPIILSNCTLKGYAKAAVAATTRGGKKPFVIEVRGCSFQGPGVEAWFEEGVHQNTVIRLIDLGIELRHKSTCSTPSSRYNACEVKL